MKSIDDIKVGDFVEINKNSLNKLKQSIAEVAFVDHERVTIVRTDGGGWSYTNNPGRVDDSYKNKNLLFWVVNKNNVSKFINYEIY